MVQDARDPPRCHVEPVEGVVGEEGPRRPRHLQPVPEVSEAVPGGEGREVKLSPDPLGQGPVGAVPQPFAQLGLAHQDDRDQVAVVELEVSEEPDLLEGGLAGDEVGFVQDEEGGPALPLQGQEALVDLLQEIAGIEAGGGHPQLPRHRAQELAGGEAGVQHHPHLVALPHPVHQGPREQGLARAHFAREQGQLHLFHRVEELLQRLLVDLVEEEVAGVGGLAEGLLAQPVVGLVHLRSPRPRRPRPGSSCACPRRARPRPG